MTKISLLQKGLSPFHETKVAKVSVLCKTKYVFQFNVMQGGDNFWYVPRRPPMYVSRFLLIQTEEIAYVRTPVRWESEVSSYKSEEFGVKKYLCRRVRCPY